MKAHEAACSIKVAILICDHDREWKSGYCWEKNRPFFYFLTLRLAASPFAISLQAKTEHVAIPFHQLNLEIKRIAWIRMFCERLAAFIPVCEATVSLNVVPPSPPPPSPPSVHVQPVKWVFRPGAEGKEPFDTDLLRASSVSHFCQVWQLIKLK